MISYLAVHNTILGFVIGMIGIWEQQFLKQTHFLARNTLSETDEWKCICRRNLQLFTDCTKALPALKGDGWSVWMGWKRFSLGWKGLDGRCCAGLMSMRFSLVCSGMSGGWQVSLKDKWFCWMFSGTIEYLCFNSISHLNGSRIAE